MRAFIVGPDCRSVRNFSLQFGAALERLAYGIEFRICRALLGGPITRFNLSAKAQRQIPANLKVDERVDLLYSRKT